MNNIINNKYYEIEYDFEGETFTYRVDLVDAKESLIYIYLKETDNLNKSCIPTLDVLDQLDYEDLFSWSSVLNNRDIYECLQAHYIDDAEEAYYDSKRENEPDDYQAYKDMVSESYED